MVAFGRSLVAASVLLAGCSGSTVATQKLPPATPIEFSELLRVEGRGLAPTEKLKALDGERVKIDGFMAQMENPVPGGFWLCPVAVFQDESGAGTGDLPPHSIFVKVRSAQEKPVEYLKGLLTVTGVLELHDEAPRITLLLDTESPLGEDRPNS